MAGSNVDRGLRGNRIGPKPGPQHHQGTGQLTRALAGEWGARHHGHAIAPGFSRRAVAGCAETVGDAMVTPHRCIAWAVLKTQRAALFCLKAGQHITGQILAIDGGMTAI
jgi:gluconate 5-dehydrogenase